LPVSLRPFVSGYTIPYTYRSFKCMSIHVPQCVLCVYICLHIKMFLSL